MSVYRYTIATPRFIVCIKCGARERDWSDRDTSRWRMAHTALCLTRKPHEGRMP